MGSWIQLHDGLFCCLDEKEVFNPIVVGVWVWPMLMPVPLANLRLVPCSRGNRWLYRDSCPPSSRLQDGCFPTVVIWCLAWPGLPHSS